MSGGRRAKRLGEGETWRRGEKKVYHRGTETQGLEVRGEKGVMRDETVDLIEDGHD